jgi:LPXTG-motif cell wall-anchored protein
MRQSIPGAHGKGTASNELQGWEFRDHRFPPLVAQGTVQYDCRAILPVTGSRSATYVAIGGALVAGGLGLVLLARRRRSRTRARPPWSCTGPGEQRPVRAQRVPDPAAPAIAAHASQSTGSAVLHRRLRLLGDTECVRRLYAPTQPSHRVWVEGPLSAAPSSTFT